MIFGDFRLYMHRAYTAGSGEGTYLNRHDTGKAENKQGLLFTENHGVNAEPIPLPADEKEQYGQLSIYNRFLIFRPEFPILPRKISEFFCAGSTSDANSRVMKGLRKLLSAKDLHLKTILSSCDKHRFMVRLSPYQGLKRLMSCHDTGLNGP